MRVSLSNDLPGRDAQHKMSHVLRRAYKDPPPNHKKAAVLILVYPINGVAHFVLTERAVHKKDSHSGQMSFPGGRKEEVDNSIIETALREANEEVGVKTQDVDVLGVLTDLYIPVSNFLVSPVLGIMNYQPKFIPEVGEVKEIVEAPITMISDDSYRRIKDIRVSDRMILKNVPYYNIQGKVVWGATAIMLSELSALSA